MKCPYNGFKDCIVEKCPSCEYETIKKQVIDGRRPVWMDAETAIEQGLCWETTRETYKFVSCKLINNSVQPTPLPKESVTKIENKTTVVNVKRGII